VNPVGSEADQILAIDRDLPNVVGKKETADVS